MEDGGYSRLLGSLTNVEPSTTPLMAHNVIFDYLWVDFFVCRTCSRTLRLPDGRGGRAQNSMEEENTWTIIGIHPIVIPKRYYLDGTCDLFKKYF